MDTPQMVPTIEYINRLIKGITEAKAKKKNLVNSIKAVYEADTQWIEFNKALASAKNALKYRELELNQEHKLNQWIEDKDFEQSNIKEMGIALSDALGTYIKETGNNVYEIAGEKITILSKYNFKPQQMRLFG